MLFVPQNLSKNAEIEQLKKEIAALKLENSQLSEQICLGYKRALDILKPFADLNGGEQHETAIWFSLLSSKDRYSSIKLQTPWCSEYQKHFSNLVKVAKEYWPNE